MKRFDVFARLPGGKPVLVESVDDLTTAEQHATRFLETFTECLVYSERDRQIVKRIDRVGTWTNTNSAGHHAP